MKKIGPGVLIAAAFIGPGTVTVCSIAGAKFGFTLLWAMVLSIFATIILQEMASRLGIITQKGLATAIKSQIAKPYLRNSIVFLIALAILLGNAAYEAGNIGGAVLGLEVLFGKASVKWYPFLIGSVAFIMLWKGNNRMLQRLFLVLVVVMSISFVLSAILTQPNMVTILKGLFIPKVSETNLLTVVALIGTTVVPYNLFLHAALAKERWKATTDLKEARQDTILAVVLGGLISMAIIVTSAKLHPSEINGALDLAKGLTPLYGVAAKYGVAIGLVAAGITSAITAPLAAALVAQSCFDWSEDQKDWKFRLAWGIVLTMGTLFLTFGIKPVEMIQIAQFANGLLLPLVAFFLVQMTNSQKLMGKHRNTKLTVVMGYSVIVIALVLGIRGILKVFELI